MTFLKNKRLCNVWSKRHLPTDLWPQILSRLPVKSLLRFRCVSKSWLSLIDNRDFARLHLRNFKNNHDETHLLVVHSWRGNCVVRCSDTFEINSETLLTLGHENREGSWRVVCSIDGLVLLKTDTRCGASGIGDLKVWNPSIRKLHEIPPLPEIETSPNSYIIDAEIGLGYDPLTNDYKHVKIIFAAFTLHSVAVYSLRANSWKIIQFQGKGCSKEQWRSKCYDLGAVCFQGRSSDNQGWSTLALIDGGCSLAVFAISSSDKSVWVLESSSAESESFCWTKHYSFDLTFYQFLYLKKNGDILTQNRYTEETLITETGKKPVRWHQAELYSPETDECRILQRRKGKSYFISHVSVYVESLILLK